MKLPRPTFYELRSEFFGVLCWLFVCLLVTLPAWTVWVLVEFAQ